jgi:hypothetical protein
MTTVKKMRTAEAALRNPRMLIGGKWVESASGEVLKVEDPAHQRPIAEVPRGEISRPGIIIERSSFKLPHPDSDEVARDAVSAGETMERLACNEVLGDLPFELDAVDAVASPVAAWVVVGSHVNARVIADQSPAQRRRRNAASRPPGSGVHTDVWLPLPLGRRFSPDGSRCSAEGAWMHNHQYRVDF